MSNASRFPKPSAVASAERGVLTLKASDLGRQNIGSVIEFETPDFGGGAETYIGRLATILRNRSDVTITFESGEEVLVLDHNLQVLVTHDSAAIRGFSIADKANRLHAESLVAMQFLSRDINQALKSMGTSTINVSPQLAAA